MPLDRLPLARRERACLVPGRDGYPGSAEIMHQPGAAQGEGLGWVQAQMLSCRLGQRGHRRRMAHRVGRSHVDEVRDLMQDAVELKAVEQAHRIWFGCQQRVPGRHRLQPD